MIFNFISSIPAEALKKKESIEDSPMKQKLFMVLPELSHLILDETNEICLPTTSQAGPYFWQFCEV